jgi:hypothetical protein
MIWRLCIIPLLLGCSSPDAQPEQPQYGLTKGNQSVSDDGGPLPSPPDETEVPFGCFIQVIDPNTPEMYYFMICVADPQMSYKYLSDPSPFTDNR